MKIAVRTCSLVLASAVGLAQETPQETRGVEVLPPSEPAADTQPQPKPAPTPAPQIEPSPPPAPLVDPAPAPAPVIDPAPAPRPAPEVEPAQDLAKNEQPSSGGCVRAFETADVTFTDDRASDRKLSALFNEKRERVVVDAEAPFAADRPPARLEPWLAELQRAGGNVERQEIECTRGLGFFKKLLSALFRKPSEPNLHAAARGYDAVLWTEEGTDQVRQIEFIQRSGGPG
jgi:hypothetical protein